ncbi:MAG: DNA methyltransferase [Ktedonobacteraceae bacterium]
MVQATSPDDSTSEELEALSEKSNAEREDWSFAHLTSAHTLWGPHGYHRYPAKFIPQLVRRIIDDYSSVTDRVGDPFLGSATTGIEALRAGRYFYGSDIHPVALLISTAKCIPIKPPVLSAAWEKLEQSLDALPCSDRRTLTLQEREYIASIPIARASAEERLNYWFPVHYRTVLTHILEVIEAVTVEKIRIFFLCAFSNILRSCSIWLSGSTKPQKDIRKKLGDPVEEFRKHVRSMLKRNTLYWNDLGSWTNSPEEIERYCCLSQQDVRHLSLPDETLDLLVTSPPYATCYEYGEMHQLTQLWFEKYHIFSLFQAYDYIGTKVVSRKPTSNVPDTFTGISTCADYALQQLQCLASEGVANGIPREIRALRWYFQDMHKALQECVRVVARNKRMVLIVGDSQRRGIVIPTSQALCEMAEQIGFELERRIVRRIPGRVLVPTRDRKTGRFSSAIQSDTLVYPEEYILVFHRRF